MDRLFVLSIYLRKYYRSKQIIGIYIEAGASLVIASPIWELVKRTVSCSLPSLSLVEYKFNKFDKRVRNILSLLYIK
ncbi:MAG: hypothetical protein H8D22_07275 [Candidatus Cloacimonetes bacterium]|nr:hypothetical protein [Candidatus Cloacimonadota bacterium]